MKIGDIVVKKALSKINEEFYGDSQMAFCREVWLQFMQEFGVEPSTIHKWGMLLQENPLTAYIMAKDSGGTYQTPKVGSIMVSQCGGQWEGRCGIVKDVKPYKITLVTLERNAGDQRGTIQEVEENLNYEPSPIDYWTKGFIKPL